MLVAWLPVTSLYHVTFISDQKRILLCGRYRRISRRESDELSEAVVYVFYFRALVTFDIATELEVTVAVFQKLH